VRCGLATVKASKGVVVALGGWRRRREEKMGRW
jgi:hypothetical protein